MGGTIDGEIYENITDSQRKELEKITQQDLVPLSQSEAELAKLIEDKRERSALFTAKHYSKDDVNLEEEIKDFLKEKGIEI